MTKEEINNLLSEENNEAMSSHLEILAMQKDKTNILKTGQEWLDSNLVGGLNNKMVFCGSRPANGKTFACSQLINNLLDEEINTVPVKILRANLEMSTTALMIRQLSLSLNKKPSDVLLNEYSESEKPVVTKVVNAFKDPRITNISATLKGDNFRQLIAGFLDKINVKDKEEEITSKKVVIIDHIHIYLDKNSIDEILLICNEFKLKDKNLSFVFYFQLGRQVEEMWRDSKEKKVNPKSMLPNSTHIYQTDILQQVADLVVAMTIPQVYDLEEFASVYKKRNAHLEEHFVDGSDDNTWSRLKGRNRIYYNVIKKRLVNDFEDPFLFCDILNPEYEEKANKLMEENTKPTNISVPVFNSSNSTGKLIPMAQALTKPSILDNFGYDKMQDEDQDAPF